MAGLDTFDARSPLSVSGLARETNAAIVVTTTKDNAAITHVRTVVIPAQTR